MPDTLIGRERELRMLGSLIDCAAVRGAALVLVGEPGAGKSVLLEWTAREAESRGTLVLRATGTDVGAPRFSGLTRAVVPLMAHADRLTATHRQALEVALGLAEGPPPQSMTVAQAVLALLLAASVREPVLIVVDDVQLFDRYSAEVLGFLATRVAGRRIGLLIASRGGPCPLGRGGLARRDLAPLDATASETLLRARFPGLAPDVRRRLLDEAHGNPLALLELPAELESAGARPEARAPSDQADALPAVLPLSERLRAVFAADVDRLPGPTREVLLLAALDATADLHVLRAAAGSPVLEKLAPAERERIVLIDEERHRLAFRHPLTRSAVIEMSTAAHRRLAHRALAAALTDHPGERARHLAASADQPDEEVSAQLQECADRLMHRGDAAGAVTALTRAGELSPAPADRGRRLAEAALIAARDTWQLELAKSLLDRVRDTPHGPSAAVHAATAITMINGDHDIDAVHRMLVSASESDSVMAELCLFGGRPELWRPFEAVMTRLSPGLRLQAATHYDPARRALPVLGELDAAIASLHESTDPEDLLRIPAAAIYVDRLSGCREILRRQIAGPAAGRATVARMTLWPDAFWSGRWDEADELATTSLAVCTSAGAALWAQLATYQVALLAAARGRPCEAAATGLIAWGGSRGAHLVEVFGRHVRALAAIGRQDYEQAYRDAAAISPPGELAPYEATALLVCFDLVKAAVHTGRHEEARAHVAALRGHDLPLISSRLALLTHGAAGLAFDDAGQFEQALAVPGAERWPFDRARVLLAYGTGRSVAEALALFESLGARPWTARLRPAPTVEALTPQELQIAELAAAGLTNKEIGAKLNLSPRTASTHLYRLFPKLGVTSRAALRDALTAHSQNGGA
ncbi:AAA family ATPase [Actinoplanes sp. NPDC051411]|uniref:helix-turn-helix transcriptional regulator n=1 Tax=Actinoplanes sp. NPDC051411 TaxID=3155522 RepID=UPI00344A1C30